MQNNCGTILPAKPKTLKEMNRRAVFSLLRERGVLSVSELSQVSGLSRTTVNKTLVHFLNLALVRASGKGASGREGGKKPEVYRFQARSGYVCSVSIAPKRLLCALADLSGRLLLTMRLPLTANEPLDLTLNGIVKLVNTAMESANQPMSALRGIAICCDGQFSADRRNIIHATHFPSWGSGVPMAERIESALGYRTHILIQDRAVFSCLGEWLGRSMPRERMLFLFFSRDVTACTLSQEAGKEHIVTEQNLSHMILYPTDTAVCLCGKRGCYSAMTSPKRLLSKAQAERRFWPNSPLAQNMAAHKSNMQELFAAAQQRDEFACFLLDWQAQWHAIALHNLALIQDFDSIVLQGEYAQAGEYFLETLRNKLDSMRENRSKPLPKVFTSEVEPSRAVLLGAAWLLIDQILNDDALFQG